MGKPRAARDDNAVTAKLEMRAQWALERWEKHPSLTYLMMLAEIRKRFDVGKSAGEQSIKRAYQILRDQWSNSDIVDRLAARYHSIADKAEADGDWHAAIRAMDSLRRHLGIGAPDRVEHSRGVSQHKLDDVDDDDLLSMFEKVEARRKPEAE